jgi:hypothetical protein
MLVNTHRVRAYIQVVHDAEAAFHIDEVLDETEVRTREVEGHHIDLPSHICILRNSVDNKMGGSHRDPSSDVMGHRNRSNQNGVRTHMMDHSEDQVAGRNKDRGSCLHIAPLGPASLVLLVGYAIVVPLLMLLLLLLALLVLPQQGNSIQSATSFHRVRVPAAILSLFLQRHAL